jgi:SAM-dependent methyltransferase
MSNDMALSFGGRAQTYDELRPGYPAEALLWALDGVPRPQVLDLGAGTGTLTRRLVELRAGDVVHGVIAVEPDSRMREVLTESLPSVEALDGSAEAIPMTSAGVDVVMVGQAFHWFSRPAADVEIGRVLRPGGVLVILTNTNPAGADWEAYLHERVLGFNQPSLIKQRAPLAPELFADEQIAVWDNPNLLDHDHFLALTSTWSWVATATPEQQRDVVTEAEILFAKNAQDGLLRLPYELQLLRAIRR